MKWYVDELPKSCFECPCFKNDVYYPCGLGDGTQDYFLDEIDGGECPLKSLKAHDRTLKHHAYNKGYNDLRRQYILGDYEKQIRKEVCEEIRNFLDVNSGEHKTKIKNGFQTFTCVSRYSLETFLDQIEQGETK